MRAPITPRCWQPPRRSCTAAPGSSASASASPRRARSLRLQLHVLVRAPSTRGPG
jgi:hypothetical protein